MAEPKVQVVTIPDDIEVVVVSDDIEVVNDHISNVKIKNIWTDTINFESGSIASGETGLITAAEAEALSDYVQKV